jgi:hypothetical protein
LHALPLDGASSKFWASSGALTAASVGIADELSPQPAVKASKVKKSGRMLAPGVLMRERVSHRGRGGEAWLDRGYDHDHGYRYDHDHGHDHDHDHHDEDGEKRRFVLWCAPLARTAWFLVWCMRETSKKCVLWHNSRDGRQAER